MKLLEHTIDLTTQSTPVTLIPFGCVHADDEGHEPDLWRACLEAIRTTPQCYAIGLGDYKSLARGHYRTHLRQYTGDEDSQRDLDLLVEAEAKKFYREYLAPIKGKLWGLAEGNHHWTFLDGTTDTQLLCRLAGVPYLEKGSLHRIRLRSPQNLSRVLKLLVHHGDWSGGAMTLGGDVNALDSRSQPWDVDIVIAGHTHRKWGFVTPMLTVTDKGQLRIVERPKVLIRGGCFTKGYVAGCVTYAERKLMKPTALGWVTLRIKIRHRYDPAYYRAKRAAGANARDASHGHKMPPEIEFIVEH